MPSILFVRAIAADRQPHLKEGERHVPYKYVWDKLYTGTQWKVYIKVMTYDLLLSSFSGKESSSYRTLQTIHDVARDLRITAVKKHPCRREIFTAFGRQFERKFFVQETILSGYFPDAVLRICGICSITFNPGHFIDDPNLNLSDASVYPARPNLIYVWDLQAGPGYAVNFTVSEFTAPPSHSCEDARVTHILFYQNEKTHYIWCPNSGKHNLFAIRMTLTFILKYYQKPLFTLDQQFTKLSAHYQIVDSTHRFLTLDTLPSVPTRQRVELGMLYMLRADNFSKKFLSDSTIVSVLKSYEALAYFFHLCLEDYLTPVIFRQNVSCNISEAETIFYDGPVQLVWVAAVPVLKYWKCSDPSTIATDNGLGMVRGSLGELTIMFLMPRGETHESPYLTITWHAERMSSNILRTRQIILDLSTVSTIHFHPTSSTFIDIVNVRAPQGKFVHLGFSEINYVLHTDKYVRYPCLDGFEIEDPMQFSLSEQICSNSTAENLLRHFKLDGLTVGQDIILKVKQYAWLGTISAVITANVHSCAGYINVFPRSHNMFSTYKNPGAIVTFDATHIQFENGSLVEHIDMRVGFKRATKWCCKLQIAPFDSLILYTAEINIKSGCYTFCPRFQTTLIITDSPADVEALVFLTIPFLQFMFGFQWFAALFYLSGT